MKSNAGEIQTHLCWLGQPAGVGGCLDLQKGSRVKSLESLCYLGPSIILELFSLGNKFTTAAFLFNKLTYKYPSYASTHRIRQSLLILAWLMTTTVFPVSAIFCRKMTEKVNLSVTTVQYQKKGKSWRWKDILTSFESRLMYMDLKGVLPCKFFQSNKSFCFHNCVSTQPCH